MPSHAFIDLPHGQGLHGAHDPWLVALAAAVALLACFSTLEAFGRLRAAPPAARLSWRILTGGILGGGVWAMHFISMTAYALPVPTAYDVGLTLASGLIVIAAAIAAVGLADDRDKRGRPAAAAATLGAGVMLMHYAGMAAVRLPGYLEHQPVAVLLAGFIAAAAAIVTLKLVAMPLTIWQRMAGAGVMAAAICGLHFTAMAGTTAVLHSTAPLAGVVFDNHTLALVVSICVVALVVVALVLAHLDRRLEAGAVEQDRLRQLNLALQTATAAAEANVAAKSTFLATMSHELRTPMNGVLGMLTAALRGDLEPESRELIETAHEQAQHLLVILNDILDLSRIEAGGLTLEQTAINPRHIVDGVLASFSAAAAAKSLRLEAALEDDLPAWIVGDPVRLRQVLYNLVGNAIKFSHSGDVTVAVTQDISAGRPMLRFDVRDEGIGISPDAATRLFERFAQADASTTRRYGGTGLGLAICRELVTLMGGQIGVASCQGEGSTFWFSLPAERAAPPALLADDIRLGRRSGPPATNTDTVPPPRPLRLLVAEDNPLNQKVLRALLPQTDFDLSFVVTGAQAVDAVQALRFDLVLMDSQMPVMDGCAAARAIRALPGAAAAIPIIALTANAMAGDRETYLAAGMNDYVAKPIQLDALLAAITRQVAQTSAASGEHQRAVLH